MGTLNFAGGASLSGSGSNLVSDSGLDFRGDWIDAPIGTIIKRGSYNTGHGVDARTTTASTSWSAININGTDQAGFGIGKYSNDGLTFEKISNKSHLEITINFPIYVGGNSGGCGIRCQASYDNGGSYTILGHLSEGPFHGWGAAPGHGVVGAGGIFYTWSTYDNASVRSNWLGHTGTVRFYFEGKAWDANSTVFYIDYTDSYPKEGTIQVSEIIAA